MTHEQLYLLILIVALTFVIVDVQRSKRPKSSGQTDPAPGPEHDAERSDGHAILVCDPTSLQGPLRAVGYTVTTARNGSETIARLDELASSGSTILVIADPTMLDMTGPELTKIVRSEYGYAVIRVLLTVTQDEFESTNPSLISRPDRFLVEPVTEQTVRQQLTALGLPTRG